MDAWFQKFHNEHQACDSSRELFLSPIIEVQHPIELLPRKPAARAWKSMEDVFPIEVVSF